MEITSRSKNSKGMVLLLLSRMILFQTKISKDVGTSRTDQDFQGIQYTMESCNISGDRPYVALLSELRIRHNEILCINKNELTCMKEVCFDVVLDPRQKLTRDGPPESLQE